MIQERNLIFLPDGLLSQIPFDVLIRPDIQPKQVDYHTFPYLIRYHTISYGQTASLYFFKPSRKSTPSRSVLAIAPDYGNKKDTGSVYLKTISGNLPELKGTIAESRKISRLLGGHLLTGMNATEKKFKERYMDYAVLHLAMHAITDNVNPLNSCLVFTPGADHKEDGILFSHEIYNLSMNASLAVLSACETGSGQAAEGEGILSLARAFLFSGCSNMVITLWKVDDQSSQLLMGQFYQELVEKQEVAKALQSSKLKYISESDMLHAHPHFWAAFTQVGQNTIIDVPQRKLHWWWLIAIPVIAILLSVILKKNPLCLKGI
jgi:CHAT domain-containing protein